jgi:hypothetical protein
MPKISVLTDCGLNNVKMGEKFFVENLLQG